MYLFCLGNNRALAEWELTTVLANRPLKPHALGLTLDDKNAATLVFETLQSQLGGTKEIIWFHDYMFDSWQKAKMILQGWLQELSGREMTLIAEHISDHERKSMLEDIKTIMNRKVRYRLDKRYLLAEKGLVFCWLEQSPGQYLFGIAVGQQSIEAYSERDYGKPSRSMLRGMLPPKLAQIMINGAGIQAQDMLWDPFCGTGTILIEAALLNKTVLGSDKDKAAVLASCENANALLNADQRSYIKAIWQQDITAPWTEQAASASCIVAEGFLGQPQTQKAASPSDLRHFWQEVEPLYQKFFSRLLKSHIHTIVLGTPFVSTDAGFSRLALRTWNILLQAGWEKVFQADYIRSNQIVGREITKLVCRPTKNA